MLVSSFAKLCYNYLSNGNFLEFGPIKMRIGISGDRNDV
jgi:hypothetical protein